MTSETRMLDQLVEQIMASPGAGIDGLDRKELDAIARDNGAASGEAFAEELELAAAAAMVAGLSASDIEPLPEALRQKILDSAPAGRQVSASVTDLASRRPAAPEAAPTRGGWFAGLGWAAAAAMFIALVLQPRPEAPGATQPTPPGVARAELEARPDTITVAWAPSEFDAYAGVSGDVVWNNDAQRGYLRLVGMPANDPAMRQYQLWIVDPERDAEPIDGGVFDVLSADSEVLIPIDAKLPVLSPSAFAITAEKPGGVVVSEGPLLLVAAT